MTRIEELTLKLADDALTQVEWEELDRLLVQDTNAQRTHVSLLKLEAMLRGTRRNLDVTDATMRRVNLALAQRIETNVMTEIVRERSARKIVPFVSVTQKFAWAAIGLAAGIILALFLKVSVERPTPQAEDFAAHAAAIPPLQLATQARVYREMQTLFPNQLQWVAQSGRDVRLSVSDTGDSEAKSTVVVRTVVVSRNTGETAWRKEWATDVLMRAEERVEVTLGADATNKLTLWAYPVADGRTALDSGLDLGAPVRLSSSFSNVLRNGEPTQVLSLKMQEIEYRVFQTIESLSKQGGQSA